LIANRGYSFFGRICSSSYVDAIFPVMLGLGLMTTAREPVTNIYHGVTAVDDYQWLEDATNPIVRDWTRHDGHCRPRHRFLVERSRGARSRYLRLSLSGTRRAHLALDVQIMKFAKMRARLQR